MKQLFFSFFLAIVLSAASAQAQQDSPPNNCTINPGACQPAPVPSDCKPGYHWTLIGSGIAHCVQDDPPCAGGTVNHDALGNPTNCQTSATRTQSCGSGYTGSIKQRRSVYKWMDGSTTYGSWSTTSENCREIPPPEPAPTPAPSTPEPGSPNPATGGGVGATPGQEVGGTDKGGSGPRDDPKCENGASDYPICTPPKCENGASDYPKCTPPTCTNGASNYPYCTHAPQPPVCNTEVVTRVTRQCTASSASQKMYEERTYDVCRYSDGRVTKQESAPLRTFNEPCNGRSPVTEM